METIKRHKKAVIVLTVVLALILLIFGYLFNLFFGGQTRIGNSAIEKYDGGYYDVTPFAERGNVQKEFNYFYKNNMGVFTSVASVLIADYSENDFKEQKEFLESREQRDKAIGKNWSEGPFSIHDWNFIVDAESEPANRLTIFGFNEKKNKIAYIKFSDNDLDSIYETPSEFFDEYIKYRFF